MPENLHRVHEMTAKATGGIECGRSWW